MTFNELKRRLAHLNIEAGKNEDGNIFLKQGNTHNLMVIFPEGIDDKPRLQVSEYLTTRKTHDLLGALRIVNKYMDELNIDPKELFCEKLKKHHLESGNVIQTNCDDYLITWSGNFDNPIYFIVDLLSARESQYSVPNIKKLGKYICQLEKENNNDVDNIELLKVYQSLSAYYKENYL